MARAYEKTLALLQANPHHPSLQLHELGGKLRGVHSISTKKPQLVGVQNSGKRALAGLCGRFRRLRSSS